MGTWNNLQEGFTVNERLPDTLVDVAVWHVFNGSTISVVGNRFSSITDDRFFIYG
ncbi:Conserved protein [Lactobacillus helveticus CIRM-BIA 101]|jgi:hypothetical protein|nr:hypothetical protein [Lactobacillus helveticus]GFP16126.1 hypothetical protein LHEJCM1120_17550 [Lactobacillus helveticus]CDI65665.1 Conserved protein [Lactobacillus helveticus CIRM-BIA 101]